MQAPHPQFSLRDNPKFLQNFRPKNTMLRYIFKLIFFFEIYHFISGSSFKNKKLLYYFTKLCVFDETKFPKLNVKNSSELCA
jgi:hypothetical protein